MIKTEELTKVFRTDEVETTALNKVSMEIQGGDFNISKRTFHRR